MGNGVIVRKLKTDDHAAWLNLWDGYLTFYKSKLSDEITALTWARLLEDVSIHGWCAVLDGEIIGICHALEHGSSWSAAPYVYLEDLYVDATIRNSGAGRALIEAVYSHADVIGQYDQVARAAKQRCFVVAVNSIWLRRC